MTEIQPPFPVNSIDNPNNNRKPKQDFYEKKDPTSLNKNEKSIANLDRKEPNKGDVVDTGA